MGTLNLLALDYGASNGRGIVGQFDGNRVALHEVHRFENNYHDVRGVLYWDILRLYEHAKRALGMAGKKGFALDAFGIDTWGVDYGLLDRNGMLLSEMISYRNAKEEDMAPLWERMGRRELFDRTGVAHLCFNTVYQLDKRRAMGDVALEQARTLLFLPDLIAYFLTGEKASEYTFATTSMLYDPLKKGWSNEIFEKLGIPKDIFTRVEYPGRLRGSLLSAVAKELEMGPVPFAVVGEHDTASAVAAIPGSGDFAFCSSGTWSLFGVETVEPVLTDDVYASNFSNEGTVQGGYRPLKNIMGLWIIQECRREWAKEGNRLSWDAIVHAAEQALPFQSLIDPDDAPFFKAGGMVQKIREYCGRTGQRVPQSVGEVARCVYESLALKYRWTIERLEKIKGERVEALNIVGGGIQNTLLNQMVSNSIGRPVITGPVEGAAMGNILMQAVALGELSGIEDVRAVVKNSVETGEYLPKEQEEWREAYHRLEALMEDEYDRHGDMGKDGRAECEQTA
ncbi:rhamnulokinase [Christensenellaceae bacterium OttesenSCG-928-M15]|nr:rhamnulokinase [Christensenellaceae bacterium OttesenSCG-928-M15]